MFVAIGCFYVDETACNSSCKLINTNPDLDFGYWAVQQNEHLLARFDGSQTYPSKRPALPAISYDNRLARSETFRPANFNADESLTEKLRQLEVRVHIAERSNQALLEELVRTQSELRFHIMLPCFSMALLLLVIINSFSLIVF